ncbi:somatostatin receptor type 3-like [Glandiceps talaboti]
MARNVSAAQVTAMRSSMNVHKSNITLLVDEENTIPSLDNTADDGNLNSELILVLPIVYVGICLAGTISNGIVIVVLVMRAALKNVATIFMLNLALADLLFMITLPFSAHSLSKGTWGYGIALCKFVRGFDGMNQFTGIFLLSAMSVDRYFAIVRPMAFRRIRTVKHAHIVSSLMWLTSLAVSLPLWIFATVTEDVTKGVASCDVLWPHHTESSLIFLVSAFGIGFVIPLVVIAIFYTKLSCYLYSVHRSASRLSMAPFVREGSRRLAVIIVIIVLAFIVCWLPFYVTNFITMTLPRGKKVPYSFFIFYIFAVFLSYVNSCLNPLIYFCLGSGLKKKHFENRRLEKFSKGRLPRIAETEV